MLLDVAQHGSQNEISVAVQADIVRSFDVQFDGRRVGARRDHQVVLELSLIAVEDEIDARIDLGVAHSRKMANIDHVTRCVIADEIVAGAWKAIECDGFHSGPCADQGDVDLRRWAFYDIPQDERRTRVRQKSVKPRTTGDEANVGVALALVRLEHQGPGEENCIRPARRCRRPHPLEL